MGNTISDITCNICSYKWGMKPIFYISDSTNLNGYTLCIDCYELESLKNILKRKNKFKSLRCEWCRYKSSLVFNNTPVFKIYWKGKFGGHVMCKKCVYDKDYRRQISIQNNL